MRFISRAYRDIELRHKRHSRESSDRRGLEKAGWITSGDRLSPIGNRKAPRERRKFLIAEGMEEVYRRSRALLADVYLCALPKDRATRDR